MTSTRTSTRRVRRRSLEEIASRPYCTAGELERLLPESREFFCAAFDSGKIRGMWKGPVRYIDRLSAQRYLEEVHGAREAIASGVRASSGSILSAREAMASLRAAVKSVDV